MVVSGKVVVGGAHPKECAVVRRAEAWWWRRSHSGDVLQQGEATKEVRHDPSDEEVAHRWLSLWRGKPVARWREDGEGGGGPVTRCGHEDEGERGGGEVWCSSGREGEKWGEEKGHGGDGAAPF
jgi:hypothetical protein